MIDTPLEQKLAMLNIIFGQTLKNSDFILEKMLSLLDNLPIPVVMTDDLLNLGYCNLFFPEWSGFDESSLLKLSNNLFLNEESSLEIKEDFIKKKGTASMQIKTQVFLSSGESRWCLIDCHKFKEDIRKSKSFIFIFRDIQKIKNQEMQILQSEQEKQNILKEMNEKLEQNVRERTIELEESLQVIKDTGQQLIQSEKMSSLGLLVAGIAHEINNPLNFLRSAGSNLYSEFSKLYYILQRTNILPYLSEGEIEEIEHMKADAEQNHGSFQRGVYRIIDLVSALGKYSRKENREKYLTDINKLFRETAVILKHRLRSLNIKTFFSHDRTPWVCAPTDISQIMLNLINNAIDSTLEAGGNTVEVRIYYQKNKKLQFIVKDQGSGINKKNADKIFDPFFTTKGIGKGTGLGLSIAKKLALEQNGDIFFKNDADVSGCQFTLELKASSK